MQLRKPDRIKIIPESSEKSTDVLFDINNAGLDIEVASSAELSFVVLRWNFAHGEAPSGDFRIMGDAWERSYGDLTFKGIEPDRIMPWYFAVTNGTDKNRETEGRLTSCFGVKVRPAAFCSWQIDNKGITLNLNVKNGGQPVLLNGRKIKAATVLFRDYHNISTFDALKEFCSLMSPFCLKTEETVYGSNNWYYAYGNSSEREILDDTRLIAGLCSGCSCKPYMVIDDGWQKHGTNPPWCPNEKFGDMGELAQKMKNEGVKPGIWVRFLSDEYKELPLPHEARRGRDKKYLDPTHPDVKKHISETVKKLTNWGYLLIKHDFSCYDLTGIWGKSMKVDISDYNEGFYDRTKTTAEIVIDFYNQILTEAGDCLILACNCFSHLTAGLAHIFRTGDDTSGKEWSRTRKMGVNTLAFRLCQHNSFYQVDADCVGITGKIDWNLNKQWLDLLAKSGTPLFVSCYPPCAEGEVYSDLKTAFGIASEKREVPAPLDWTENSYPSEYLIDDKKANYNWYNEYGTDDIYE
ncbi:MAG: alpha-galactosidase [Clostridia bacterium]|nr:alpha-galactosidase [Clostridia bacterium]